jgi:hypothetical protein
VAGDGTDLTLRSPSAARTAMGLGTAAVTNATAFATAAQGIAATNAQGRVAAVEGIIAANSNDWAQGGGTTNHAALGNLGWEQSGHTAPALGVRHVAGFNDGAAEYRPASDFVLATESNALRVAATNQAGAYTRGYVADYTNHQDRTDNPHTVTAAQLGALTAEADTLQTVLNRGKTATNDNVQIRSLQTASYGNFLRIAWSVDELVPIIQWRSAAGPTNTIQFIDVEGGGFDPYIDFGGVLLSNVSAPTNANGVVTRDYSDTRYINTNESDSVHGSMILQDLAFTNLVRAAQTNVVPAAGAANLDEATGTGNLAFTNAVQAAQTNVVPTAGITHEDATNAALAVVAPYTNSIDTALQPADTNGWIVSSHAAITNYDVTTLTALTNNARPVWLFSVPQAATLRSLYCRVNSGSATGNLALVYSNETNAPTKWYTIDGKRALNTTGNLDTSFPTSALPARQMVGVMLSELSTFLWTNSAVIRGGYTIP